ncbi:MAG: multiple resistance and pH regulation protein F (MrpF / PhaF) superfamily [Wolbachia endosymbiont of Menacanthus eurysternus]|nr:MAG: multiple resistance and pH regulation protein F (MrpF / PhaF) superfamily [Wolbachia endosymbiont of Menacanthus eurysternus]
MRVGMIVQVAICVLLLCIVVMIFSIVYGLRGVYDKMLAFNNFSTQVVLLIVAVSIITNSFFLLDIALLYASISFVSVIALMRLVLF